MKHTTMRVPFAVMLAALLASPSIVSAKSSATPAGRAAGWEQVRSILCAQDLHGLDGRSLSLGALQGEVVVINFWASWCRPCRRELPALDALNTRLAKSGGRVVAISIDEDASNVRRFVREHGLMLPVYHDGPDGLARRLDLDRIPYTLVLGRDGAIAFASSGADEAALAELNAVTQRLLAAPGNASSSLQGGTP